MKPERPIWKQHGSHITFRCICLSYVRSRIVIGATVVAFGTSIPELVTSIDATRKGHLDLALGNIVGSGFINITCILGVALLGTTLNINMAAFSNLVIFSLITNLFLWYFLSSEKLSWREGTVFLLLYSVFVTGSFGGYKCCRKNRIPKKLEKDPIRSSQNLHGSL